MLLSFLDGTKYKNEKFSYFYGVKLSHYTLYIQQQKKDLTFFLNSCKKINENRVEIID